MSENALGGANEIRASSTLSGQSDENGSRIGQGDTSRDGRPSVERGTLRWKKRKTRPKKRSMKVRLPSSSLVQVGTPGPKRKAGQSS